MTTIFRAHFLSRFTCLGDRCEDTCCQQWSMQVDEPTLNRYREEAPELLDAVEPSTEAPWIMRKDPSTGFCVKLENGLCGIYKKYGERFLGDACHFYPRATRSLGDKTIMTAALSCPEIVRLALAESRFGFDTAEVDRLPVSLKDYLPEAMNADDALAVHEAFLASAMDPAASAERAFCRIASVTRSIERLNKSKWAQVVPVYLRLADTRLPEAQQNPADPFNLLHALCGLVVASKKPMSKRLSETVADMEKALAVTLDWQNVLIHTSDASLSSWQSLKALWEQERGRHDAILKRYLAMQLSLALFPFAGLGDTLSERVTILGVRLATVKLALMCAMMKHGPHLTEPVVVRVIQSLSRLLDHLADPGFSIQIYKETGWDREARMRGLLDG